MIERVDEFIGRAFKTAVEHGFHDEKTSFSHQMMLVIGEIGECVEADRKGRVSDLGMFDDAFRTQSFEYCFETYIKDTMVDEMADICIRLFDMCGYFRIKPLVGSEHRDLQALEREWGKIFAEKDFCEKAYTLVQLLCACDEASDAGSIESNFSAALTFLYFWAKSLHFDLAKHIDLKMRYNEGRAYKHGKKY